MSMMLLILTGAVAADLMVLPGVPLSDEALAIVQDAANAETMRSPIAIRSAATRLSEDDDAHYARLSQALTDVRPFETKLDGELVIMQDLRAPIDEIRVIRNAEDRDLIYAALAYQGFAVNRYFESDLGENLAAEPYRIVLEGVVVERPWFNAFAIEPDREVTPYEIAEAPQRVAYARAREEVSSLISASIVPKGLPEDSTLHVDGRLTAPSASGNIRLPPGRHLIHVTLQGEIIERYDLTLTSGEQHNLSVTLTDERWSGWLDALARGDSSAAPAALHPHLDALGGSVSVVTAADTRTATLATITPESTTYETIKLSQRSRSSGINSASSDQRFSVHGGLQGGWLSSGNFYTDQPETFEPTRKTVNAIQLGGVIGADLTFGVLQAGVGLDLLTSFGKAHKAYVDANATSFRFYPHVTFGIRWVRATAGFTFPHHPTVGLDGTLLEVGGLEVGGAFKVGLPGTVKRTTDDWRREPLFVAGATVRYRLHLF